VVLLPSGDLCSVVAVDVGARLAPPIIWSPSDALNAIHSDIMASNSGEPGAKSGAALSSE